LDGEEDEEEDEERAIGNVTIIHLLYSSAGAGTRGRGEVLGQAGVVEA